MVSVEVGERLRIPGNIGNLGDCSKESGVFVDSFSLIDSDGVAVRPTRGVDHETWTWGIRS